jgi:MFS transporter, putative metabolite:H+ symporter
VQPVNGGTRLIAARLDRLPSSRPLWNFVVLLSLGAFFEIYDLMMTAYVSPLMITSGVFAEGHTAALGLSDQAAFAAVTFAGLFVGTLLFGSAADRFGRRVVFTYALLWYAGATLMMASQTTSTRIFAWRFAAGVGVGIEMVTIDAFIAEIVNKEMRGRAFALNQGIQFCAVPTVAFLCWMLAGRAPLGIAGWRYVAMFPVLGAIVVWALRLGLPESPRWLAQHGRLDEAEAIVLGLETRVARDTGRVLPPPDVARVEGHGANRTSRLGDIFVPPYRRRTIALAVFNFFQTIGFYGFGNWVPKLVSAQGVGVASSLQYSFVIALAFPVGPFVFTTFADRFERKWQIVAAAAGTATFGLLFTEQRSALGIIAVGTAITLSNNLLSYSYHAYQAEVFPTRIRTTAVGFVYSFSRISTVFTSFLIAYFSLHFGNVGVFAFIAASMLVAASAIGFFGPPTHGRTLEQICE